MTYKLEALYNTDKDIRDCFDSLLSTAKCKKIEDLTDAVLVNTKITKNTLANAIVNLVSVLNTAHSVLKCASVRIEELQSECIDKQKSVISLQEELIQNKNEEATAVQSAVTSEIKSWADIVSKTGSKTAVTAQTIQRAVKTAIGEDQRYKNIVVFGLQEAANEDLCGNVKQMLQQCTDGKVSAIKDCVRIGADRSAECRPVKVSLESREAVVRVLSNAKLLRQTSLYKSVFISPDRTVEERAARKKLVSQLKEKMASEPELYHFIQNGQILSTEKELKVTPAPLTTTSSSLPCDTPAANPTNQRPASQQSKTNLRPASQQSNRAVYEKFFNMSNRNKSR